ncbi:hypothetical protein BJV82DRAFT_327831 [Fennellomyces sp. T-0311]|nr:hypothetical protein BJV82DRAFT_327831 [Fennellomyces sp. T-0311]
MVCCNSHATRQAPDKKRNCGHRRVKHMVGVDGCLLITQGPTFYVSGIMLDDSKESITFPVVAALLLGAAKVLRQQSMMIYSDVLHLWSRIRPRLADAKATDAIDLQTSVAKIRKITLTELEHIDPFVPETYYPFADLFDWTFQSPSLPALIDDTGSVTTSAISAAATQDQQDEGVEDHYYPAEYVLDMSNVHLLSPGFLEDDYSANVFAGDVQNNSTQQPHEEPADDGQEAVQNLSIADFMDFDYGEQGDILADMLDDHQRLVGAAVLRRPGHRLLPSSDTESDDEDRIANIIWNRDPAPPISHRSTPATEDMSMVHHVSDSSNDESEQDNVPEPRARRRQVRRLTSDTSTTVPAVFYQQCGSLIDVENPRSIFRPKRARKSGSTTDHLFDQPFVAIGISRTNVMWQHQRQRSRGMMDVEMEVARRNQSDSSSVPSVDLLRDTIFSDDHHRLHGSRGNSKEKEIKTGGLIRSRRRNL